MTLILRRITLFAGRGLGWAVIVLAGLLAGFGWLYVLRGLGWLGLGPRVGDAALVLKDEHALALEVPQRHLHLLQVEAAGPVLIADRHHHRATELRRALRDDERLDRRAAE